MDKGWLDVSAMTEDIFLEGLGMGVTCVDTMLNVTYWNNWLEKHSNTKKETVLGKHLGDIFPEIGERNKIEYISECIKSGNPAILSTYLHHHFVPLEVFKDGQVHTMMQNTRIFPAKKHNEIVGAVIIIEDQTETILHEKIIEDLNRMLTCLKGINRMLVSIEDKSEMLKQACDILGDHLNLIAVWGGKTSVKKEGVIEPQYGIGIQLPTLEKHNFKIQGDPSGLYFSSSDVTQDACTTIKDSTFKIESEGWLTVLDASQSQSFCIIPLRQNGQFYGTISVYSKDKNFFNADIKSLLEEISRDLSFGLDLINERKQRKMEDQALDREKRKLEITLHSIGDGVITTDDQGFIVMMNAIAEQMTGWERSEASGKKLDQVFNIVNEITQESCVSPFKKVMATKGIVELANHTLLIRRDGTKIPIHDSGAPILTDKGEIAGVVLVFQDDTKERQILNQIEESEKKYRSIIEYSADHIFMISLDGVFLSSNNKTASFPLLENESLVGKSLADVYSPEVTSLYKQKINEVIEIGSPVYFEHVLEDLNGDFYDHQDTLYPIFRDDTLWAIGGICHDMTEFKKLQKEEDNLRNRLQQAQKMESIGHLAGGIAHDFNNILFPVIGFAQLSMEQLPQNHPVHENLQDILNGAMRAKDLVKQILMFSRKQDKLLRLHNLRPLVQDAVKLLRSTIPSNIEIKTNYYDGKDKVLCDETEFNEMVMNLCTNAYHSIGKMNGTITIALNKVDEVINPDLPDASYVCLSVGDTGCGIPEKIIDKIFEPYLTTKEIGKGSGLGLSVVHGIVTSYKGDIKVESVPGKGTVFNVYLPVTEKSIEPVLEKEEQFIPKGTEKIIFVDDESSIVKLGVRSLGKLGYDVSGFENSWDAYKSIKADPKGFDLIITDMAMPKMTGLELYERIRHLSKDIPVIICSGYSEHLNRKTAEEMGIKMLIDKPVTFDELATKIRQVLDQK